MIYWYVKESLYLVSVQIHGNHAVHAYALQEVCAYFGADRYAGFIFAVLTCPTEVWDHGYHLVRAGALSSVNGEQKLHDVVAAWAGRLHDIHRLTANGLLETYGKLTVRKTSYLDVA